MKLKVLKPGKYGTRRLQAGETFDAPKKRARVWKALKRVEDADPLDEPAPAAPVVQPDPLDGLRARAEALGVKVDGRWGEMRLQHEIATAGRRTTYERRDMQAEG